eukprot:scaffold24592_cov220-Cylindrotheca_fusiformis.AAC.1
MHLTKNDGQVEMRAERLLTGTEALPYLEKYFSSLLQRLQTDFFGQEEDEQMKEDEAASSADASQSTTSILEWLPDIAIITGPMSIRLPDNTDPNVMEEI